MKTKQPPPKPRPKKRRRRGGHKERRPISPELVQMENHLRAINGQVWRGR